LAAPTLLLQTDGMEAIFYEVNRLLWQFGRGKPWLGGLTVEQTETMKKVAFDALNKRGAETRRSCTTAPAWFEVKGGMSEYVPGYSKMS
jgi:hypothetical protein